MRHDAVYREALKHVGFQAEFWIRVPWMRVSTLAPALWAGRVVMQAVVALQVGDVWVRRVRVRHVTGRGTEVMWGGRRSVQVVPVHLKTATLQLIWRGSSTRGPYPCQGSTACLIEKQPAAGLLNCPRLAFCKRSNSKISELNTYRYHNTKHVNLLMSPYKTCKPTSVTIQNV